MQVEDLLAVRRCNMRNLPENYQFILYMHTLAVSGKACLVAEEERAGGAKAIVGYIMGKMRDELEEAQDKREAQEKTEDELPVGHIMSLCVEEECRGQGIATNLIRACIYALAKRSARSLRQQADGRGRASIKVVLNVRVSNTNAISVYRDKLGFAIEREDREYYPDKESAYFMGRVFSCR